MAQLSSSNRKIHLWALLRDKVDIHILQPFMARFDRRMYAFLFNAKAVLLYGSGVRVHWVDGAFAVTDKSVNGFEFRVQYACRCGLAYSSGIRARGEQLHRAYGLDLIDFADGDVFLDCGANVGDIKIGFDLNEVRVDYVGFEPSPVEYACLSKNVAPAITHNVGLWNEDGELAFFLSSLGADSSLIEPGEYTEKITVPTRRLDSYIDGPVKCLKLEAEGAEPEILEGAGDKLELVEYVAADLGYERGVSAESTIGPVTNFLLSRDFELIHVSPGRLCALYRNLRFSSKLSQ